MTGKFYVVATPIGNMEDITLRALEVLKNSDIILAEDTRKTGLLLKRYNIESRLSSYHQHSPLAKREEILQYLIDGKSISLVTDAGTPGISDPGNELIDFILRVLPPDTIVPVPGASSLTAVLSVAGFYVQKFVFIGFFPRKKRKKLLTWIKEGKVSFAFFESPHRIYKTLHELSEYFGSEIRIAVGRELTKMHETLYRGTLKEVIKEFDHKKVKGEIVVVVELY